MGNVCKTPTLDGICRIFIFIIFVIFVILIGRCYSHMVKCQVWWHMFAAVVFILWQMVLPLVVKSLIGWLTDGVVNMADGSHLTDMVADVIAIVADGMATL